MPQVFITGASSDIGLALCRLYLDAGYDVVGHYHRGRPEFDAVVDSSPAMTAIKIDFSDPQTTERQIEAHCATLARSDALVHLAATYAPTPYGTLHAEDVMRAVATNAVPGVLLTQLIGPAMAQRGFGRIVQVSSIGVKFAGGSNSYCYALSKHALELIPAAHKVWAASNVLINALRIGVTDTRFHGLDASKDMRPRVAMIPARRMATPAEIAEVLFWYGSEKNSFVTGEVVAIAGGE